MKLNKAGFLFVIIIFSVIISVSGCVGQGGEMIVEKGDHVSVDYWGSLENGMVFDTSEGRGPLEFDVGAGQMIKGFDNGVIGMKINETKTITIPASEAYGMVDPKLVVDVPLDDLRQSNITPAVGMKLYAQGREVVITKVTDTAATIDFNHPLAGKTLIFKIKMLNIVKKK
jgi:FKBP-type peptidyl-prolyl cis-trans isomerase 2